MIAAAPFCMPSDGWWPWIAMVGLAVAAYIAGTYYEWFEFRRNHEANRYGRDRHDAHL